MSDKFLRYFFLSLFVIVLGCDTDNNIDDPDKNYFLKMYGEDGDQVGVDMEILSDGSTLLLGTTVSDDNTSRIYLVKINAEGDVLWNKKFGEKQETAVDIEPAKNGNYIILSSFMNTSAAVANVDSKIILISADGVKLDSATNGFTYADYPKSVTSIDDGGFIVTGSYEEIPNGMTNVFHFRCDVNLDWLTSTWANTYGQDNGSNDTGIKVYQISPTLFYVFGHSELSHDQRLGRFSNLLYYSINDFSLNSTPAFTGEKDVDAKLSWVCKNDPSQGNSFVLLGTKFNSNTPAGLQFSILRTPLAFNETDEQIDTELSSQGKVLTAVCVAPSLTSPTGYLVLCNETRTLGSNIWLTKIDQSNNPKWSVSLGSENENDFASVVRELPDGRILVLGTISVGDNQSKMALFKLNSNGRLQE